jgi:hypothetical protein
VLETVEIYDACLGSKIATGEVGGHRQVWHSPDIWYIVTGGGIGYRRMRV